MAVLEVLLIIGVAVVVLYMFRRQQAQAQSQGTTTTDGGGTTPVTTSSAGPCICDNALASKNCGSFCTCTACWLVTGSQTPCTPTQDDLNAVNCPRTVGGSTQHNSKTKPKSKSSSSGTKDAASGLSFGSSGITPKGSPKDVASGLTFGASNVKPNPHPLGKLIPGLTLRAAVTDHTVGKYRAYYTRTVLR